VTQSSGSPDFAASVVIDVFGPPAPKALIGSLCAQAAR